MVHRITTAISASGTILCDEAELDPSFLHLSFRFSIELSARVAIPEWGGQRVQFNQEEDAAISPSGTAAWVLGRQSALYVIDPTDTAEQQ